MKSLARHSVIQSTESARWVSGRRMWCTYPNRVPRREILDSNSDTCVIWEDGNKIILYLFYRDPLFLAFLLWRKIKLTRSAFFAYRHSILRQHVCAKEFAKKDSGPAPSLLLRSP